MHSLLNNAPRTRLPVPPAADGMSFDTHGLACFSVPKCVAAEAFSPGARQAAYLLLYLHAHYRFVSSRAPADTIRHAFTVEAGPWQELERVVCRALGLELATVKTGGNLPAVLAEHLAQGAVAFVPVDKAGLQLGHSDSGAPEPHLAIACGYDATGERLRIVTTAHLEPLSCLALGQRRLGDMWGPVAVPAARLYDAHAAYNRSCHALRGVIEVLQAKAPADPHAVLAADLAEVCAAVRRHLRETVGEKAQQLVDLPLEDQLRFCNSQLVLGDIGETVLSEAAPGHAGAARVRAAAGLAAQAWKDAISARALGTVQPDWLDRVMEAEIALLDSLSHAEPAVEAATVERPGGAAELEAPRDDFSDTVRAAWARLLGVGSVPDNASWFDLGGDSMLGITLVAELRARLGVVPPLRLVVQSTTFREFVAALASLPRSPKAVRARPKPPTARDRKGRKHGAKQKVANLARSTS